MERASNANNDLHNLNDLNHYEDLHIRTPDDTVLILRKFDMGKSDAVLVVPDVGETFERMMQFVPVLTRCNVYLLELRGHGLSEGKWSAQTEKTDIAYIVGLMKKRYRTFVLAKGMSATILLDAQALADGIIVIAPRKSKPVRVQTPTIAINTEFTSIFGNIKFFHAEHLQLHHVISVALQELQTQERPIAVRLQKAR